MGDPGVDCVLCLLSGYAYSMLLLLIGIGVLTCSYNLAC
jgi:hypothetical protein